MPLGKFFAADTFALSVTLFLILAVQAAEAFIANFYGCNGRRQENAQGSEGQALGRISKMNRVTNLPVIGRKC
jgi:hypothetical protein